MAQLKDLIRVTTQQSSGGGGYTTVYRWEATTVSGGAETVLTFDHEPTDDEIAGALPTGPRDLVLTSTSTPPAPPAVDDNAAILHLLEQILAEQAAIRLGMELLVDTELKDP